jgi:hypothetical protein
MQIAANPRAHRNFRLKVGEHSYERHANNVNWGKSVQQVEIRGGTPDDVFTDTSIGGHVCNITVLHDYQNEDSLYNFLRDHEGEQAAVEWQPDAEAAYTESATITLVAPNPGGAIGAFGESTVACPSSKPVRTFAAPAVPTVTSLDPDTGDDAGGTLVSIVGTHFNGTTGVTFDGAPAQFEVISSS